MSWPLTLALGLFVSGCGIEATGTLDVDDVPQGGASGAGNAGFGGDGGGGVENAGEGGVGGSSGQGGISGAGGSGGQGGTLVAGAGGNSGSGAAGALGGAGVGGAAGQAGQGGAVGATGGFAGSSGSVAGMSGQAGEGGQAGQGGASGSAGAAGAGGDTYAPVLLRPQNNEVLGPTRAYLLWKDGSVPASSTIAGYDVCYSPISAAEIDGEQECPNMATVAEPYSVIDGLPVSTSIFFKVRTHFSDATVSSYTGVRQFMTDNSLKGWWRMDGSVADSSSQASNGSLQGGASFVPGFLGQALSLNGQDGGMTAGTKEVYNFGTGEFSVSAWVRPSRDGLAEALVTKRSVDNGYEIFRTVDGKLAFYGSGCGIAVKGGSLPKDEWHHVLVTRSSQKISLFVDGVSVAAGNCADNFNNAAALTFGCAGPDLGCAEAFEGSLDDIFVYGAVLSQAEILNDDCTARALSGMAQTDTCLK